VGAARPLTQRRGRLRAVSGVLTGGLVALALALVVAALLADRGSAPGPGTRTVVWHGLAAVVAVAAQRVADRRPDPAGATAAFAVVALTAAVVGALWLA
jgi:hypothetical protein